MSEKAFTVTEGRLRAMAKECPDAKRMLEKGFPEAFKGEEEFIEEEVDGMIEEILIRCKAVSCMGSGSFVGEKAVVARQQYLIYRILNYGVRAVWVEKNKNLDDWLKAEEIRRRK